MSEVFLLPGDTWLPPNTAKVDLSQNVILKARLNSVLSFVNIDRCEVHKIQRSSRSWCWCIRLSCQQYLMFNMDSQLSMIECSLGFRSLLLIWRTWYGNVHSPWASPCLGKQSYCSISQANCSYILLPLIYINVQSWRWIWPFPLLYYSRGSFLEYLVVLPTQTLKVSILSPATLKRHRLQALSVSKVSKFFRSDYWHFSACSISQGSPWRWLPFRSLSIKSSNLAQATLFTVIRKVHI
jgi:hypothetical protein